MKTLEMKIAIPEVKGGRITLVEAKDDYILVKFEIEEENKTSLIEKSDMECKIDPLAFDGEWIQHQPITFRQKELLTLYKRAKSKGMLHAFTCMTLDPSIKDGKLIYKKGLMPAIGFSQEKWAKMLKEYNPSRNSRQMTKMEYACRNLFLISRLVQSGYQIDEAWGIICDDSKIIGHYNNSDDAKGNLEPTGSREVCGFYDLANVCKLLSKDPWEDPNGFWCAGGSYNCTSFGNPVNSIYFESDVRSEGKNAVGLIALD